ncbi:MAG TPA: DUF177 domain-containing protein [Anaerolineales bacterium]
MSNPRRPFRINVGFIVHEEVGYTAQFPFKFDKIKAGDDLVLRDFAGVVDVGRTPQGLVVTGEFTGTTTLECARCLRTFDQQLKWEMTELYAFTEKSISESGLLVPEDAHLDLEPLVRDYALLEIPIRPICKPDCKGLCPVCGQDLNVADCGHRPHEDPSPFSTLKKML